MRIDNKIINDFKLFFTPQFIKLMESGNLDLKNINESEIQNVLFTIYDNYCRLVTLKYKLIDSKEYKHIFKKDEIINKDSGFKNYELPAFERLNDDLVKKLTPTITYVYEVLLLITDEYVLRRSDVNSYKTEVLELFEQSMKSFLNNLDKETAKNYRKIWGSKYPHLFSHVLFKKLNNDLNKYCMVSKFSGLSSIKDKNKHKMLNAKLITLDSQNILDIDGTTKKRVKINLERNLKLNKNNNLSGVGSVVYLRASELLGNLQNLISHKDDQKCYNQILNLNKLNIKSIFIIHDGIERININDEVITPLPSFNQLYPKYTNNKDILHPDLTFGREGSSGSLGGAGIKINFLSLDDFCIIYSTLKYERKRIRAIRSQVLNIQKNKIQFSFENKFSYYYLNFLYYLDLNADIDNSIFCFVDSNWSKVKGKLLECGIDINRGDSVKRGLLSPINFELSLFLDKFSENAYRDITTSFNLKDKVNSKDINYSNNYTIKNYDEDRIIKLMNTHINNIEKVIKNKLVSKFNIDLSLLEDKEFNRSLYDLCVKEILFTSYYITDDIISNLFVNYINQISDDGETLLNNFSSFNDNNHPNKGVFQKLINPQRNQKREYSTMRSSGNLKNKELNTDNNSKIKDKFYDSLRDIILQAKDNPVETQRKIEKEWINILMNDVNKEQNFLRSKLSKIVKNATEGSNTDDFKKILRRSYGDLSDYLVNDNNILITLIEIADSYKKSKRSAIAKNIGYSMMRELFSLLVINKLQRVNNTPNKEDSWDLAGEILEEYPLSLNEFIELIAYYSNSKVKITDIIDLNSQYVLEYLESKKDLDNQIIFKNSSTNFLVTIGTRFIELFSNRINSVFIEYAAVGEGSNNDSKLVLNDEFKDLEDKFGKMVLQPKNLPMVCPPGEWGPKKYGGYLENKIIQEKVITGSVKYNAHEYKNLDMLYNTINYFNNIKFGINKSLLEYIEGEGSYLFPNTDKEALYNFNISIKIANLFKDIPFYLNTHADWRGRLYTHCFYITYQGSEISNALLQYWKGEPLTDAGLNVFYAFGASIFSNSNNKEDLTHRIDWVKTNKSKILNMNSDFICEAESPVAFAAFCIEMRKLEVNRNVEIKMPVFIDATCSGIQHISALIGDTGLATKVNLIPNVKNNHKPDDIYQSLVEPINNAINEFGRENPDFKALSNLYLTRKELKQPIMTLNYNVSVFGMKEQLYNSLKVTKAITENEVVSANKQNLKINNTSDTGDIVENLKTKEVTKIIGKTKDNEEIELSNRDLIKIAMIIRENIFIQYPALKTIYDYFIEVAAFMKELELPVQWVTPTGAEITQKYTKKEKIKLRIHLHNKIKTRVLYNKTNRIDFKKQIDSLIPNVIHSLDSSHIIKLINAYGNSFKYGILTVHDCFGTHPNHVDSLFFCLKEEFILLYINSDFLKKFDNSIKKTINSYYNNDVVIKDRVVYKTVLNVKKNTSEVVELKIPTPPKKKDLQYDLIRYSKWMFN